MSNDRTANFKRDFLASIVVFLVALPLCMGIAIASGAPVSAGIITGVVGGIVVGSIAGCPLQVSGPAAGLIVLVYEIIQRFGLETLGVVVLLAGAIQLVAGMLRWGQWFRAVSPAVIRGMLAGIGVLIFASQFHVMVDDRPHGSGIENLITIPQAVVKSLSIDDFHHRELRKFRADTLRNVGELHRRQERLYHVSLDPTHSPGFDAEKMTEEQQAITSELAAIAEEIQRYEAETERTKRLQQIREAAVAAQGRGEDALAALQAGDMPRAAEVQEEAAVAIGNLLGRLKNHSFAALVGLLTIGSIVAWGFTPKKVRVIPAPLIAVIAGSLLAAVLTLPVLYVEVPSRLWEEIHLPSVAAFTSAPWYELAQAALVIAVVASAETLLCATAVDKLQNGAPTKYDQELCSQGVGNMICGFLGALPMTGVIVRSSANIHAGAATRLSAIMHGVWLLLFVAALAFVLRMIPTASLAAILVYTGYKLFDIKAIQQLRKYGWGEVIIYAATVITIVVEDLLTGVLVGLALALVKLLYTFSHLNVRLVTKQGEKSAELQLEGAATFVRLPRLATELERVPPGTELHVEFGKLDYIDHACLDLLMTWAKRHEATGGKLVIDWDSLHATFRRDRNGAASAMGGNEAVDKSAA